MRSYWLSIVFYFQGPFFRCMEENISKRKEKKTERRKEGNFSAMLYRFQKKLLENDQEKKNEFSFISQLKRFESEEMKENSFELSWKKPEIVKNIIKVSFKIA